MERGKKLSPADRADIARLLAKGESYPDIAAKMGCTVQNIKYHAAKIKPKIVQIREKRQAVAIDRGLRDRERRVDDLEWLAGQLREEIAVGLYGTDIKISASGQTVSVPVFKNAQIQQFRATLDDIAKEVGGRKNETVVTDAGLSDDERAARIAAILDRARTRATG